MDGIYEIVISGNNANGEFGENVLHYSVSGTSGGDDAYTTGKALAQAFEVTIVPLMIPMCGNDVQINLLSAKQISPTKGPTAFVAVDSTGSDSNPSGTFAAAALIRVLPGGDELHTGHVFVWGLPDTAWIGGGLSTAAATAILAFASGLLTSLAPLGGTANFGTYTKKTHGFVIATDVEVVTARASGMNKRTVPVV